MIPRMVPAAASIIPRLLLMLLLLLLLLVIVDTNTANDDDGVFGVGAFAQWTQFIPVVVCVHRRTGRVSHRNGVFRVRSLCFVSDDALSFVLSCARSLSLTLEHS